MTNVFHAAIIANPTEMNTQKTASLPDTGIVLFTRVARLRQTFVETLNAGCMGVQNDKTNKAIYMLDYRAQASGSRRLFDVLEMWAD